MFTVLGEVLLLNPLCWSVTVLGSQGQAVEGRRLVLFLDPQGLSRLGKTCSVRRTAATFSFSEQSQEGVFKQLL